MIYHCLSNFQSRSSLRSKFGLILALLALIVGARRSGFITAF